MMLRMMDVRVAHAWEHRVLKRARKLVQLHDQSGWWGWWRKFDPLFRLLGYRYMLKLDTWNGELERPDTPYRHGRPYRRLWLDGWPNV